MRPFFPAIRGLEALILSSCWYPDFDSRRIVRFQGPTEGPAGMINVGFADGHAVQLRADEADERIRNQIGQRELMNMLPAV